MQNRLNQIKKNTEVFDVTHAQAVPAYSNCDGKYYHA